MINTIKYNYNFNDICFVNMNNKYYIKNQGKLYEFSPINNIETVYEEYLITKQYKEFDQIIINKNKKIFTEYNNRLYVLIEKKNIEHEFPIQRLLNNNIKYLLDRTNWNILWSRKVDYIEYQSLHIKGKYEFIDESIDYYLGMAETAINYFKYNINDNQKELSISRRRMIKKEYYNPLNIIVDYSIRDIAEYLKEIFWTKAYNNNKIKNVLNKIKNINECKLLYARLLFPNYYFDQYEKIINNICTQEELKQYINRVDEYEKYLSTIFYILKNNYKNLIEINWLHNIQTFTK